MFLDSSLAACSVTCMTVSEETFQLGRAKRNVFQRNVFHFLPFVYFCRVPRGAEGAQIGPPGPPPARNEGRRQTGRSRDIIRGWWGFWKPKSG